MVNFPNALALPSKNNIFAKREMDLVCPQFILSKMETCGNINEPYPVFQQEAPLSEVNRNQSPFAMQAKPSPSYMDDDTQFNFPNYQLQNGSRFNSHVMAENKGQPIPVPYVQRDAVPMLQRQYSINTVMEVIDSHDITDLTSPDFMAANPHQQLSNFTQSQPICIQRHDSSSTCDQGFSNSCFSRSNDHQQRTVLAPPASDISECIQRSRISSSPGGLPFTGYQENFIHAASPNTTTDAPQTTFPPTPQYQTHFTEADTVVPAHPTEDQLSPYQPVFSPSYSCEMESPSMVENANDKQYVQNNQVFTFDDYSAQFAPTQSSSSFDFSTQQQFVSPSTPPESANTVTYVQQRHNQAPPSYDASVAVLPSTSTASIGLSSTNLFQLEEVDKSIVAEDLRDLSRTPISEQGKTDLKRIRNNKACRASRERRKKRKADKEALADSLLDANRQLKEKVRQLEEELSSVQENVRRVMSQNYPGGQAPPLFDNF